MQQVIPSLLATCLFVLSCGWASAQSNMATLRLRCDEGSAGAAVSFNGRFKGECPFDVMVPEGTLKIEARKQVGKEHERVFTQEIRLGAGTIKSIELVLGKDQLTAEATRARAAQAEVERRQEEARQAEQRRQEEVRRAEQQRKEVESARVHATKLERLRRAAESGDAEAMLAQAEVFEAGHQGQPPAPAQALTWYLKAAEAGNVEAMFRLSEREDKTGQIKAHVWLRKAAQAGHRGAEERLAQLPRYCEVTGRVSGFLSSTIVRSPGFENTRADGTEASTKAVLERYVEKLRLLQPGVWGKASIQPTLRCTPMSNDSVGNGMLCNATPASGTFIYVTCWSRVAYLDELRLSEAEARKSGGKSGGDTILFDWRE